MTAMRIGSFVATWLAVAAGAAFGGLLADDEARIVKSRLIPCPKQVELTDGPVVKIDRELAVAVTLKTLPEGVESRTKAIFKDYWGAKPRLAVAADASLVLPPDGYRLSCAATSGLAIAATGEGGLLNALKTLRQVAEPARGGERLMGYVLPDMTVEDEPSTGFRGLHLCWFPESDPVFIEKGIRMAAYYKFNAVVLEPWAVFDYASHPEFTWQEKKVRAKEFRRLARLAREQGVTLIPQLNLFGHASGSRHISGKHAVLDFHPELQPLFEPDGWTWCLSNPATRKVMTDLALELYEAFDRPPYFHIGCDEAYSMATCLACRRADYAALLRDHIRYFHDFFAARGATAMMWHDMLITATDPRWKGYVATGSAKIGTEALLDALPRDIVICDWQYDPAPKAREVPWPTMLYFRDKGFPVLACPWRDASGIRSQGRWASEQHLAGMLCTTWNYMYGQDMYRILTVGAQAAWGGEAVGWNATSAFNQHLRQVGWDMPVTHYRDTGDAQWQVPSENALQQ